MRSRAWYFMGTFYLIARTQKGVTQRMHAAFKISMPSRGARVSSCAFTGHALNGNGGVAVRGVLSNGGPGS